MGKKEAKNKKKTMNNIKIFVACIFILAALFLSFRFDFIIVKFVSSLQNPVLNKFMLLVTYLGSSFGVLFILTSLFLWHEHKRKWLLPLWTSLLFSVLLVLAIKIISARVRPFYLGLPTLSVLVQQSVWWDSSFPSVHAAVSFCALPLLDREFPRFKYLWLAFAFLVAFSRIYFALHYLSDVIVGAVVGYATGFLAVKLEEKYDYSSIIKALLKRKK